jgi:hypothetical protein
VGGFSDLTAVLRFHLRVGARVALRVLVPVIAALFGGGMILGVDFLNSLARMLYGPGSAGGTAMLLAFGAIGVASAAAPRVCRGLDGWLRHLPVPGRTHRRAAVLAIAVTQAPLFLLLTPLSLVTTRDAAVFLVDVLAVPVTALAAALFALPVGRGALVKPLALAAAILPQSGGWTTLAAGACLLVVADQLAGPLRKAAGPRRRAGSLSPTLLPLEARIAWRALGWRLAGAYGAALLPLASGWAFVAHNELPPVYVARGALLGGGLATVLLLAQMGETLAARRPAWPWSRSLPWPASQRVAFDALFVAAHAVPLLALAAVIHPPSVLALLALLPLLAVRTAGAMRRAPERRTGASGEILMEGGLAAALVALLPWVSLGLLAFVPWAVRAAAERERRQKVSRWLEIHHLAVGDPQSWSAG